MSSASVELEITQKKEELWDYLWICTGGIMEGGMLHNHF